MTYARLFTEQLQTALHPTNLLEAFPHFCLNFFSDRIKPTHALTLLELSCYSATKCRAYKVPLRHHQKIL